MESTGDIFVLPFFGQGHLNPAMELCRNISSHNYNVTLVIPSHLSSSIPSTFSKHSSLIHVSEIQFSAPPDTGSGGGGGGHPLEEQNKLMGEGLKLFLSERCGVKLPTCVVIDVMMSWSKDLFVEYKVPFVTFFTSGATNTAMEYGRWKANVGDMQPGDVREIPGLPKQMAVTFLDLSNKRPRGAPSGHGSRGGRGSGRGGGSGRGRGRGRARPGPGSKPRWIDEMDGSVALLINTCDDLEHPFIEYIAEQTKLPVWGVGPLLPEKFWKSAGSILHDHEMRSDHKANYTEDEVFQWLESKPSESVIYISFGSEVGPNIEEYKELAKALEESEQPFIWVIQPGSGVSGTPKSFLMPVQTDSSEEEEEGYYPEGLDVKVGDRGLIITGWAPQLLILSHPSTGGFLSHCGWNSTVETIGRGVPILGWPIRGDQFDNAKLVANHLKIGFVISRTCSEDGQPGKIDKEAISTGIKKLMTDENVHKQAKELSKQFEGGFPVSSVKALGAFVEFISEKTT